MDIPNTNLKLPGDDNALADVQSGDYERHYQLRQGDVVFDCGAHVGYFTTHAAQQVGLSGYVFAFEPDPRNYSILCERTRGLPNVSAFPYALTVRDGITKLWHNPLNSGANNLVQEPCHDYSINVLGIDLASWILLKLLPVPDFIKMDIEGSELLILPPLITTGRITKTKIAMEVHSEPTARALANLFKDYSWTFTPKDPGVSVGLWYATK